MAESYLPQAKEQADSLRMFAGSLSTALGSGGDQNYLDEDSFIRNLSPTTVQQVYNPSTGGTVLQGTTTGDVQKDTMSTPIKGVGMTPRQLAVGLLAVGGAWWAFKQYKKRGR
jgi:hypothetical protein